MLERWKAVDEIRDGDHWIVEARWAAVVANVVRVAYAGLEGGITGSTYVGVVRPGEVGLELEAVRKALFNAKLQGVIAGCRGGLYLDDLGKVGVRTAIGTGGGVR